VLKGNLPKNSRIEGFVLPKWRIFNRSKEKKDASTEVEMRTQYIGESEEKSKTSKISDESEEMPIKVYNETLYSKGFIQKKPVTIKSERKHPLKRSSWENLGTIERNIDDIEYKKIEERGARIQTIDDIDQKVDCVLYTKNIR
jgi:hypothetical protein